MSAFTVIYGGSAIINPWWLYGDRWMNRLLNNLGQLLAVIGGALLINNVVYLVTKSIGSPTVIAGLGWTLDVSPLNSIVFQVGCLAIGVALSYVFKLRPTAEAMPQGQQEVQPMPAQHRAAEEPSGPAAGEAGGSVSAMDRAMQAAIEQHTSKSDKAARGKPRKTIARPAPAAAGGSFGRRRAVVE
jgi:uncharacterized membrane protein